MGRFFEPLVGRLNFLAPLVVSPSLPRITAFEKGQGSAVVTARGLLSVFFVVDWALTQTRPSVGLCGGCQGEPDSDPDLPRPKKLKSVLGWKTYG